MKLHPKIQQKLTASVLYLLLAAGSALFILPFLWMVGTSFKLEREMSSTDLKFMPETPVPAQTSPYYDIRAFPRSEGAEYRNVEPLLSRVLEKTGQVEPDLIPTLLPALYHRLQQVVPARTWTLPEAELEAALASRITNERLAEVRRKILRQLRFGAVRARSIDLQEKNLTEGAPPGDLWTVKETHAAFRKGAPRESILAYDFSKDGKQQVQLEALMDLPFRADRLHRIQIALIPDDSWHRMYFEVEKNGVLYRATRPQVLADVQPTTIMLQQFGPDDAPDSSKIKLWLPYKEVARGNQYDHGANRVHVRVTLRESSQLDAWWGKISRNYIKTLAYIPFWRYAATSIFLVVLNIIGHVFSCSLAAYAFARLSWPGRNISFGLMLATMMIPPQVTMIPFFLIIKGLGWYNTLKPLWVLAFFGNAFNIFLLRQFMKGIPRDLEDAAKIDGCNFMHIYWHVIMPLIKPTLACIAVFTFLGTWNNFMGPLIFLSDQRLYPLSLGLYAFKVQQGGDFGMMMAGSLLMTLPIIVIFFFAQRYFIQGIALTGTKG